MSQSRLQHPNVQDLISRTLRNTKTNCLEWQQAKSKNGYGKIHVASQGRYAHRLMAQLIYGDAPEDKPFVLHSCHNPPCINPDHLRWGSPKENMDDMARHNRAGKTFKANTKFDGKRLTVQQVQQIRKAFAEGHLQDVIAKEYGIGRAHVSLIVTRRLWKNV